MPRDELRARQWRCLHCGAQLGTVDRQAGTLFIVSSGIFAEHDGQRILVHCPVCGEYKQFGGQSVKLETQPHIRKAS